MHLLVVIIIVLILYIYVYIIKALEKAKEAGRKERFLVKQREQLATSDQINLDLTYSVSITIQYFTHAKHNRVYVIYFSSIYNS